MAVTRHEQASQPRMALAVDRRVLSLKPWWERRWSGTSQGMNLAGLFKDRSLIRLLGLPNGIENACPDIGQGADGDGMALALGPLALVILLGPRFLERALPGKLVQGIAPGLDTAQATMGLLVRPALEEDGRCASQGLQTACVRVSAAIITHFGQQARS